MLIEKNKGVQRSIVCCDDEKVTICDDVKVDRGVLATSENGDNSCESGEEGEAT